MNKNKRNTILFSAIALLIIASVGIYIYKNNHTDTSSISVRKPNSVDYSGPSAQDKQETQQFKENQQKESQQTPAPAPTTADGLKSVTPVISYAGQYDAAIEASAFIPDLFEDGGTCTLTLTKQGSATVTKTSTAQKDATSTRCQTFTFPSKELSSGSWSATVSYASATAKGNSQATTFTVK